MSEQTASPTEDERTQAERWAITHFGDRDMWALLDERQRARMVTAMLPLVREAKRVANGALASAILEGLSLTQRLGEALREGDRLRAEQASRPAPLTEAPSRELVEALYQLRATLSTREQRDRMRAVTAIVHASWLTLAAPPSRGDIPADVRPPVCGKIGPLGVVCILDAGHAPPHCPEHTGKRCPDAPSSKPAAPLESGHLDRADYEAKRSAHEAARAAGNMHGVHPMSSKTRCEVSGCGAELSEDGACPKGEAK